MDCKIPHTMSTIRNSIMQYMFLYARPCIMRKRAPPHQNSYYMPQNVIFLNGLTLLFRLFILSKEYAYSLFSEVHVLIYCSGNHGQASASQTYYIYFRVSKGDISVRYFSAHRYYHLHCKHRNKKYFRSIPFIISWYPQATECIRNHI